MQKQLSILLFKEGTQWVAQCLELDVAAQGDSLEDAKDHLLLTLSAEAFADIERGEEPWSSLKQAPSEFYGRFNQAKQLQDTSVPRFRFPEDKQPSKFLTPQIEQRVC